MKVCVGGTFDILHKGHETLIDRAISAAGKDGFVYIGLATGDLIKNKKNIKTFKERKKALEDYLGKKDFLRKTKIVPIDNKYGLTLIEDYDAIVVSPETENIAKEINNQRKKMGKVPLNIIKIPHVLSYNGKPISSTRIKNGEIKKNGEIVLED